MKHRSLVLLPLGMLLLAVAEIAVFIAVVHAIGAAWSLLLLIATSILGLVLLRREGIRGWRAFRAAAEAGQPPGAQVSNSLVGLLGALLLAVPGLISAAAGLLLVLPPVRTLARHAMIRATERHVSSQVAGDLFGPRRVRVRRGTAASATTSATDSRSGSGSGSADFAGPPAPISATAAGRPGDVVEGEVVEGEIVR